MRSRILYAVSLAAGFFAPALAKAHEVYVLTPNEVSRALMTPAFNEMAVAQTHLPEFFFWAFVAVFTVFVVFFASVSHSLERRLDPWLRSLRTYAAAIARVTVGLSFIAGAYYQATYGPELPISASFGAASGIVTAVLVALGILFIFGLYVRIAALVALALFCISVYLHGVYMLTYTNYVGEILVLLILGSHHGTTPHEAFRRAHTWVYSVTRRLAPYSFAILRVCFGVSLLFSSMYAKILHNNLALLVADLPLAGHAHSLAQVLGFEPHFLVLGAAIIEIVIAAFFILGIEIRFVSLFLLFWLSLSLLYFGESVWPHVILIGIPIAFICYGYDKYSLEGFLFKKGAREPVL